MSEIAEIKKKLECYMKYLKIDEIEGYELVTERDDPVGTIMQVVYSDGVLYATLTKGRWIFNNIVYEPMDEKDEDYQEYLDSVFQACENMAICTYDRLKRKEQKKKLKKEQKAEEAEEYKRLKEEYARIRNEKLQNIMDKVETDSFCE